MDVLLLLLGVFFIVLGIIGSFIPILPGPITSWIGLLFIHLTNAIPYNWTFILTTFTIAIFVYILDYIIPAIGTKKFGGSKYGIIGTTVGLIFGLIFLGPFGIIVGPFIGAFIGVLIISVLQNGLAQLGISEPFKRLITGLVIILAVLIDRWRSR